MRGTLFLFVLLSYSAVSQKFSVILGRPTDKSITASVVFDQNTDYFLEYGTSTGVYTTKSSIYAGVTGVPEEIEIPNLTGNTRYFYRLGYKLKTVSSYANSPEYSFITQRHQVVPFLSPWKQMNIYMTKKGWRICIKYAWRIN